MHTLIFLVYFFSNILSIKNIPANKIIVAYPVFVPIKAMHIQLIAKRTNVPILISMKLPK